MRILVVEDEKKLAAFIKKVLEREKYAVDVTGPHANSKGCN